MIVLKRTLEMKVRFTKTELDALTKKARKSGLSREGYCRRVLNGVRKRFLRHLRELLFHIILHGSRPAARPSLPGRRSDAYVVV